MLQLKDLPNAAILSKFAERYPDANIEQVINFLTLLRVGSDLSLALDRLLAEHGLLQGRWWVLILLMREDDLTSSPSILAAKAGVTRATMSGLIDGLLKEDLVSKVSDVKDRRVFKVRLTDKGQARLDEVMPGYYQRVDKLMSVLTHEQAESLSEMLKRLKNNLSAFE